MEAFFKDLKHSLRMFAGSPAFTIAAVAALTLGIGANAAIFSVVDAVLLKPVGVMDPDRVVVFINTSPRGPGGPAASPAKFMHYRQQTGIVQDVAAFNTGVMNYTGGEFPEQLKSGRVSADFFKLAGAPMLLGRSFTEAEDRPAGPNVAVISRSLWETRFSADPNMVGKSISLGGEPYTIVGVLNTFDFRDYGPTPQVWTLFQFDPNTSDQGHYFQAMARLKPGVTVQQAYARMQASANDYRAKFPKALGPKAAFGVLPIRDAIVRGDVKASLYVYLGAVAFVLLIACANVANLLLVRAAGRASEVAVRTALGAGRRQLLGQSLAESMLIAVGGAVLGTVLAVVVVHVLRTGVIVALPRMQDVSVDARVLAFAAALAIATGLVFGLVPALHASGWDIVTILRSG
ncbi:MAG TPA: ABC transporter permease, partial [Vicinamibacterales bacterium]